MTNYVTQIGDGRGWRRDGHARRSDVGRVGSPQSDCGLCRRGAELHYAKCATLCTIVHYGMAFPRENAFSRATAWCMALRYRTRGGGNVEFGMSNLEFGGVGRGERGRKRLAACSARGGGGKVSRHVGTECWAGSGVRTVGRSCRRLAAILPPLIVLRHGRERDRAF